MLVFLLVEGHLERDHLASFLRRAVDALEGHGLRVGKMRNYRRVGPATKAATEMYGADAVFALFDLKGFPGVQGQSGTPAHRARWLKGQLISVVPSEYREKFHPHVAVHELEAWILADKSRLTELGLTGLPAGDPEDVNFTAGPKGRLAERWRLAKGRGYQEVIDGARLLQEIDPQVVRNGCPHFRAFITDLERTLKGE